MKKKLDPLFALSVLVLVLGIFALACSWVPFQGDCTVSDNVAHADAVASVTPETFSWGVDSGQNFMNPALGARCFLLISFTGQMTSFVYDGVTGPTPLALLKEGSAVNTMNMLIGTIPGTIGETSVIAIIIGAIFLILMGVIDLRIPGTYIVTFAIFVGIFGHFQNPAVGFFDPQYITAHLCGGGLMLGAWFMATDYVTSPITKRGQIVYGALLGILTGLFRLFGGSAEGVSYAIIISNLLVPLIERVTLPKPFGKGGEK